MVVFPEFPYVPFDLKDDQIGYLKSLEDRVEAIGVNDQILTILAIEKEDSWSGNICSRYKIHFKFKTTVDEKKGYTFTSPESTKMSLLSCLTLGAGPEFMKLSKDHVHNLKCFKRYKGEIEKIKQKNLGLARKKTREINLYNNDLDTLIDNLTNERPGRCWVPLETGTDSGFIYAENPLLLRARAHLLGAHHVANYVRDAKPRDPKKSHYGIPIRMI